jgi:hypothetical protein
MFSEKDKKFNGFRCRFLPPMILHDNQQEGELQWKSPLMGARDWCGQFLPKDNLTAVEWIAWKKGLLEDARTTNVPPVQSQL